MGMFKILKGKKKSSKPQYNGSNGTINSYDITKKQYKEIKKRACPWKFTVVESSSTNSYLTHDVLVYSYIQNNGIQQLKFQNKKGVKVSSQTQLPFYFSKPFCISDEFYYYEIKVIKNVDSKIYFGLGLSNYMFTDLPGTTTGTVAYHSSGLIYANGSVVAYAKVINEDDVVGIGYYPSNGNIFFTLNGKYIQTLSGDVLHKQRFFPHLGSDGECTLEVNFGMTHFIYVPNESNKYLTTEQLNNRNIKDNEQSESREDDLNNAFKDSNTSFSSPKDNNISKDPSSTEVTNNASYIENANKKIDNNKIDFFESIDNGDSKYTSNIQSSELQYSNSTIFSPVSDSSSSINYNKFPSSSSTLFNNSNFGSSKNTSTLFPIAEDPDLSTALVPASSTNNMQYSSNPSNPFSMYMNNNNNNNGNSYNYNNNNNNNNNYNNYNYNTSFSSTSSFNPNNPFNDIMSNNNTNNDLLTNNNGLFNNNNNIFNNNTFMNNSFSNNNNNNNNNNSNNNIFSNTFNNSYSTSNTLTSSNTYTGNNTFSNNMFNSSSTFNRSNTYSSNSFNSSNPFNSINTAVNSNNNFGNTSMSNISNSMFNNTSTFSSNNLLLPSSSNVSSSTWMPSSSSIATSTNMNSLATSSVTSPVLTITRSLSLNENEHKSSFNTFNNTGTKHLSVNNIMSSSSFLLNSNMNSNSNSNNNNNSNDILNKSLIINTNPTSPALSNYSSNLSSPINSPFNSSFGSPSLMSSPNFYNSTNNFNDMSNSNANILANTSMDSSFSFSGTNNGNANTFSGTNNNIGTNSNSIFNMNSLIDATNVISDNLTGNKNKSPLLNSSTPNYQNNNSSSPLNSSFSLNMTSSNPVNLFNTPFNNNPGSPSSSNPFGTPSSPIKPLALEASPSQSTSLSFHAPITSSSILTNSKVSSQWDNTINDNFTSPVLNTNSPQMVPTNITGTQSIHSNPFEGIH